MTPSSKKGVSSQFVSDASVLKGKTVVKSSAKQSARNSPVTRLLQTRPNVRKEDVKQGGKSPIAATVLALFMPSRNFVTFPPKPKLSERFLMNHSSTLHEWFSDYASIYEKIWIPI
ncbi:MAG TPA: hypothetical protein VHC44_01455 [Verrucomicrobiae bacterium]|nr:hypothetical protein [Verrucomicrobiae bacterium]